NTGQKLSVYNQVSTTNTNDQDQVDQPITFNV
ncbi:spore germination protein, partial [Peribacillus acanthi]